MNHLTLIKIFIVIVIYFIIKETLKIQVIMHNE